MRWQPFAPRRSRESVTAPVDVADVRERARLLGEALALGGSMFPPEESDRVRALLAKAERRTELGGGHTVVALAGATGSGKSSLFNALVGADVARVGVTRPTTSRVGAATWGETPAELLDWLGVSTRHTVSADAPGFVELEGLVLLDLPDLDSRILSNRAEADRILGLCDAFVWVTDPQKYADALLHEEYVREFARTRATSMVVLNQIDRLTPDAARSCLEDLARLLARDGLTDARVVPASTVVAGGGERLLDALTDVVQAKNAANRRVLGDLRLEAQRLGDFVGSPRGDQGIGPDGELVDALAAAAGVPAVLDAVERDHRREAARATGWPLTRWVQKARPQPLARLGLNRGMADAETRAERRITLGRSSLPEPTPAARAAVDLATRRLGERASQGLPEAWRDAVDTAVSPDDARVPDALDQAVLATPLRSRRPWWWPVVGILQWTLAAIGLLGVLWLVALAGLASVQIHLGVPTWGWLPIPLILAVAGLLGGFLLAVLARALARRGAVRARAAARRRLDAAVEEVARERLVAPVADVLRRHDACSRALAKASA